MVQITTCDHCNKKGIKKYTITKSNDYRTNVKPKEVCSVECAIEILELYKWKDFDIDGDEKGIEEIITKINAKRE